MIFQNPTNPGSFYFYRKIMRFKESKFLSGSFPFTFGVHNPNSNKMKNVLLIVVSIFSSFHSFSQTKIIDLPLQELAGFGDFQPTFGFMSMDLQESKALWGSIDNSELKTPKGWEDSQNIQVWVDFSQLVYQNYKIGNIDLEEFESWEIDTNARRLSDSALKCFVNVLIRNDDEKGTFYYMIDTDNDSDFSDEKEMKPFNIENDLTIRESEKSIQEVDFQFFRNGKLIEQRIPIIVAEMDGKPVSAISQYFISSYLGNSLQISHGFSEITFASSTEIRMVGNEEIINLGEFLKIDDSHYKNLGVNFDKQLLKLQKMPKDTILYSSQVGFMATSFEGIDFMSRKQIKLEDYKGKLLYLDFWGSWCKPCVEELPNLKELYEKLDHSKVEFLGIALDNATKLRSLMGKMGVNWTQILEENEEPIAESYNVNVYPTTLLIDENGKIIAKDIRAKDLEAFIEKYLKDK